jgi:hypothetical protein
MLKPLLFLFCSFGLLFNHSVAATTLQLPYISNPETSYEVGLLKLALSYSTTTYTFDFAKEDLTKAAQQIALDEGKQDVLWGGTSKEQEKLLLPIRIPIYKGLVGHRLLVIRPEDQPKFDAIHDPDQLKTLKAGQGTFWIDGNIFRNNQFPLITAVNKDSLYYMLDGGRFDYLPRGVHEPWAELSKYSDLKLSVEKHLMIIYRLPQYFFVNRKNTALAKEIEQGLEKAIVDGQFDHYFYHHPIVRTALEKSDMAHREILMIHNPDLPDETPTWRHELWLDYTQPIPAD